MKPSKLYSFVCYDNGSAAFIGRYLKDKAWTNRREFEMDGLPYRDGARTIRKFRVTVEEIAEKP
ncbi:MAG: hypothetical protein ABFE13_11450 [Phycisphaerales bacterium]